MQNQLEKPNQWIIPTAVVSAIVVFLTIVVIFFMTMFKVAAEAIKLTDGAQPELILPDDEEAGNLARTTLLNIDTALKTGDFKTFRDTQIASLWKRQITTEELAGVLKPLNAQGIDFSGVGGLTAEFDKAHRITEENLLEISGSFPSQPARSFFELGYLRENDSWALIKFYVYAKEEPLAIPEEKEIITLTERSLLDFNAALQQQDFQAFHGRLAKSFQTQITPEGLKEAFISLIDAKSDLSPIKALSPAFDGEPVIDDDGVLAVNGSYTTATETINFELSFFTEAKEWKLFGIGVNIFPVEETTATEETVTPLTDLVQFLREKVVLPDDGDQAQFLKQLQALTELETLLAKSNP